MPYKFTRTKVPVVYQMIFRMCNGYDVEYIRTCAMKVEVIDLYLRENSPDPDIIRFKNHFARTRDKSFNDGCHILGSCIPDPTKVVVAGLAQQTVGGAGNEAGKGSCVESIYFLWCDEKYRNALRQVLNGTEGAPVGNVGTDAYKRILERMKDVEKYEKVETEVKKTKHQTPEQSLQR